MLTITGTDSMVRGLHEMIGQWGGFDLESGTDVRSVFRPSGGLPVTMSVGENIRDVMHATRPDAGSALLVITPQPLEAQPPVVMVGLHGFSNQPPVEGSFPLPLIDDWGVDDVMAAAFDSLGNPASVAVLIDLAVLDLAFEPGSQRARPGGLDPRRLARAAYLSGRHSPVNNVGLVAAVVHVPPDPGPHANLAHVALSFCAGLAAR